MDEANQDRLPAYPLAVGPTGRYLVDQAGAPVLVHGDAAWSIIAAATREETERYLDDGHRKGVNSIIANILEAYFAPDPPRNRYGAEPFTSPGDFGTPNEVYFEHVDWVIREAGKRGIQVLLVPAYLGYPEPHYYADVYGSDRAEGWLAEVLENGVEGCREYGRYLGRRYGGFDNILWVMGGDRNPDEVLPHVRAMAAGIAQTDDRHLFTAHVSPEGRPFEQYPDDPWLTLNLTYSYAIVHAALLREYCRKPIRPNVLIESTYEYEHNASEVQIRRQAYWAILCGACGQFIGTNGVYDLAPGWEKRLDSPGRVAMSRMIGLFGRYRWWNLVPDLSRAREWTASRDYPAREFITAGIGELRGLDYCAAARTPDGTLAMAYMPTARTVAMDLSLMADGGVAASWFDPVTGAVVPAGTWPARGSRDFTPPAAQDWLLILEG